MGLNVRSLSLAARIMGTRLRDVESIEQLTRLPYDECLGAVVRLAIAIVIPAKSKP